MKFIPTADLQPLMVVLVSTRSGTNELWTVTKVDIEEGAVYFLTTNREPEKVMITTNAATVIGTRPSLHSHVILYFPSENAMPAPPRQPVLPDNVIDRIIADMQKDDKPDVQSMLETHLRCVVDLIKDGESMGLWRAPEKMREAHRQLGNLYIEST